MGWLLAQCEPEAAFDWFGERHSAEILGEKRAFEAHDPLEGRRRAERVRVAHAEVLLRTRHACATEAPFRERWARFWLNHFAIQGADQHTEMLTGAFLREAIEPFMFGRFEDLLVAASQHPAMLASLDQFMSVGPNSPHGREHGLGLNENLGREMLELHTVGVGGGYIQADVTELARALTGWRIGGDDAPPGARDRFFNDPRWREPGARRLLGEAWAESDDRAERMVRALAHRPETAERIAFKLARHFVADQPPADLVRRVHTAFVRSGGDLRRTGEALVTAPESWSPEQRKFKTPLDFFLSAHRATGLAPEDGGEITHILSSMGQSPMTARTPEGWSDEATSWATPLAVQHRADFAWIHAHRAPHEDSRAFAREVLGPLLPRERMAAVARLAQDRPSAFAMVLMTPEFMRR
jgi:uncharacterized protein (DUF1800 family)